MSDPTEFLKRTFAEVRARAEAASVGNGTVWTFHGDICLRDHEGRDCPYAQAAHIADWDPARVLRMVQGGEKLLELHHETTSEAPCNDRDCCAGPHEVHHCAACDSIEGVCPSILIEAERWGWTE